MAMLVAALKNLKADSQCALERKDSMIQGTEEELERQRSEAQALREEAAALREQLEDRQRMLHEGSEEARSLKEGSERLEKQVIALGEDARLARDEASAVKEELQSTCRELEIRTKEASSLRAAFEEQHQHLLETRDALLAARQALDHPPRSRRRRGKLQMGGCLNWRRRRRSFAPR